MNSPRLGVFPGSFDPPTIAHLAVAERALASAGLDRLDLTLSRGALGKPRIDDDLMRRRRARLEAAIAHRPGLRARVSDRLLVAELAQGYDAVVLGADKWRQILDPVWYGSVDERDRALRTLPLVLIAPRGADDLDRLDLPASATGCEVRVLDVPVKFREVNATAVRERQPDALGWELPETGGLPEGPTVP